MRVFGRMAISGSHAVSLEVEDGLTIRSLRLKFAEALQSAEKREMTTLCLMKDGQLLSDAALLLDAGLSDGCQVELLQTAGMESIITACNDCVARIFSLETGHCIELQGHFGQVYTCILSPDQRHLVTASEDGSARIWEKNSAQGVVEKHLLLCISPLSEVYSAVFSHDGNLIVTAAGEEANTIGTATVWNVDTGKRVWTFGHRGEVYLATFSCDDALVLTASGDGTAALLSSNDGSASFILDGHAGHPVNRAEFSPDGLLVVTASTDAKGCIWDRHSGSRTHVLQGCPSEVKHASFSADSRQVFLTHATGVVEVFCAATGSCRWVLDDHREPVYQATGCPNSRLVALASEDGRATIWDLKSGRKLHSLAEHTDAVTWISWDNSGDMLITASWDGTVKLWSTDSGECLDSFEDHAGPVIYAEFGCLRVWGPLTNWCWRHNPTDHGPNWQSARWLTTSVCRISGNYSEPQGWNLSLIHQEQPQITTDYRSVGAAQHRDSGRTWHHCMKKLAMKHTQNTLQSLDVTCHIQSVDVFQLEVRVLDVASRRM